MLNCDEPLFFIIHAKAHGGGIIAVSVDTAHDTLIIAEEEDGEPSYAVDEDEESPLFVLAGYIVARDVIHGYCCWPVGLDIEWSGSDRTRKGGWMLG